MIDILDEISKDLAVRKHELTNIYLKCRESDTLRRCYVLIAAAHFEGFVRTVVNAICDVLEKRNIKHNELRPIFTTLTIEKIFQEYERKKEKKFFPFINLHEKINNIHHEFFQFKKMESRSLKYNYFKTILDIFELDDKKYELRKHWLDETLLGNRHKIAHGEKFTPTYQEVEEIHDYLMNKLLDFFYDDISFYLNNKSYLHSS